MKGKDKILLELTKLSDEQFASILEGGMIEHSKCVMGECLVGTEFCKKDKSETCGETILHYLQSEDEE